MLELSIIVLNYRTADLSIDCLATLEPEMAEGVSVLVVDNASGDGSAERIEAHISDRGWSNWARVLQSPVNGGFAAGNNLGIRSVDAAAYVLLNSDTLVRPGAVAALREAMRQNPDAGIIGAQCVGRDGHVQDSYFRFPGPLSELIRVARTGPVTRAMARYDVVLPGRAEPSELDWVGFACVLIRREVLETVGPLDEGYFMYYEDVDYCHRAQQAGWRVMHCPEATVVHLIGGSSDVTTLDKLHKRAPRYYYEARSRYFAKFHGRSGLWFANGCWYVGRVISFFREALGRPPGHREGEARDIWIDAVNPLRAGKRPANTSEVALDTASHDAPLPIGDRNCNPPGLGFWALLAEDYRTHGRNVLEPGFLALVVHRFGNARMGVPRVLRPPLTAIYLWLFTGVKWAWGIEIDYTVRVGRRLRIWHHGGIVLGARAIGDDVHIRHNTTFGVVNRRQLTGKPIIGNRVDIGVGACVVGPVTVGDDAVIGPNSVVLRHVPPGVVVMGVPARRATMEESPSREPARTRNP
jgi:GT2 family glycosyltransferase/serine acetyltransferase